MLTGVFTSIPDDQRECPSIGMQTGTAGTGGAVNAYTASNQPMWDMSNTTTWVNGKHTLNFGVQLPALVAAARPGDRVSRQLRLQRRLHRQCWSRTCCSGTTPASGVFQPAGFSVPGAAGNPREFNFKYFAPYVQDDWNVELETDAEPGPALGLPERARTKPTTAWAGATCRLRAGRPAGCRPVAGGPGHRRDGAYYQYAGRRSPENAGSLKVFAPRLGFAWRPFGDEKTVVRGGYGVFFDSAEGREIDGAADVYPYVSRGNYITVGRPADAAADDGLAVPELRRARAATPAANTFLAVSHVAASRRNPYVQQWSLGVQRELFREHHARDQLHRHARGPTC